MTSVADVCPFVLTYFIFITNVSWRRLKKPRSEVFELWGSLFPLEITSTQTFPGFYLPTNVITITVYISIITFLQEFLGSE